MKMRNTLNKEVQKAQENENVEKERETSMKKTDAFRRAAALMAALSITVSLAAPAFCGAYYIDDGDIIITKDENGRQTDQTERKVTQVRLRDNGEINHHHP